MNASARFAGLSSQSFYRGNIDSTACNTFMRFIGNQCTLDVRDRARTNCFIGRATRIVIVYGKNVRREIGKIILL